MEQQNKTEKKTSRRREGLKGGSDECKNKGGYEEFLSHTVNVNEHRRRAETALVQLHHQQAFNETSVRPGVLHRVTRLWS